MAELLLDPYPHTCLSPLGPRSLKPGHFMDALPMLGKLIVFASMIAIWWFTYIWLSKPTNRAPFCFFGLSKMSAKVISMTPEACHLDVHQRRNTSRRCCFEQYSMHSWGPCYCHERVTTRIDDQDGDFQFWQVLNGTNSRLDGQRHILLIPVLWFHDLAHIVVETMDSIDASQRAISNQQQSIEQVPNAEGVCWQGIEHTF